MRTPDGDERWKLLYEGSFPEGTVCLWLHLDTRLCEVTCEGRHRFLDRTLEYAKAVQWLRRLLMIHGRKEFETMSNHIATHKLEIPAIENTRQFYHV